jgi:hypothetical protein
LSINKESSYDIRIKILEAVDENFGFNFLHERKDANQTTSCSVGSCVDDLSMFLERVGSVWARKRVAEKSNINRNYKELKMDKKHKKIKK